MDDDAACVQEAGIGNDELTEEKTDDGYVERT